MSAHAMAQTLRGTVSADGHTVELEDEGALPPGTKVVIVPDAHGGLRRGSPEAVLSAMRAEPRVTREDYLELMRLINETRGDADWSDPFAGTHPPDDAESEE